ncbi:hypothetical protein ACO0QE_003505 [Hanseniaspora vineae]
MTSVMNNNPASTNNANTVKSYQDSTTSFKLNETNADETGTALQGETPVGNTPPPPLPHVNVNQLPLSLLIRNLCIYSIGEIKQFFKLTKPNRRFEFLKLIVYLRNQFLRLYVLVKWCKTIKNNNFHLLIDMLNYLRQQNMNIGHCIWHLKNSVISSTINAKLPNPDLETALEVFNLGRPNLKNDIIIRNNNLGGSTKTFSTNTSINTFLNNNMIPTELILKKLRDLNVLLSIRVSMMELPAKFSFGNHFIQDGRLIIRIPNEYEIHLSTATPQSPFYFVDFKILLMDVQASDNTIYLKKYINDLLLRERDNTKVLHVLEHFLDKYLLSLKLYLCHKRLGRLSREKYSNNLMYHYDQKKSVINIKYWVFSRIVNPADCKITIGISKNEETAEVELILRWEIGNLQKLPFTIPTVYKNDILNNLFDAIDEIIFNHIQIIKHQLVSIDAGIFTDNTFDEDSNENTDRVGNFGDTGSAGLNPSSSALLRDTDNSVEGDLLPSSKNGFVKEETNMSTPTKSAVPTSDSTSLTVYLPSTCTTTTPVKLKINPITGLLYFSNPNSPLLLSYMERLNKNVMKPADIVKSLYQLKLAKIVQIFTNMFSKCGWTVFNENVMKLPLETLHPHHNTWLKKSNNILIKDMFIRMNTWPANWYLVVSILSSPSSCFVETKIAKIVSKQATWCLKYLSDNFKNPDDKEFINNSNMMKLEHVSYQRVDFLSKTILSKIINHIVLDSLNELGIEKNIVSESAKPKLPTYIQSLLSQDSNSAVIAVNVNSLMKTNVSILDTTLFLLINCGTKNHQNKMSLFGRFTNVIDTQLLRSSDCTKLMIEFIDEQCFVMTTSDEKNERVVDHLSSLGKQLAIFKKKLSHLIVLSDVVTRLTESFHSPDFQIVSLKPKEIAFNYFPKSNLSNVSAADCTITLKDIDEESESVQNGKTQTKLEFALGTTNPQMELNQFLRGSNYGHEFLFKYFQFTSKFFFTVEQFKRTCTHQCPLFFNIHSMSTYEIAYILFNKETSQPECLKILLEIRTKHINRKEELLYHISVGNSKASANSNSAIQKTISKITKSCFEISKPATSKDDAEKLAKCKSVVKLNSGVCCSDEDIEEVLKEIHNIIVM